MSCVCLAVVIEVSVGKCVKEGLWVVVECLSQCSQSPHSTLMVSYADRLHIQLHPDQEGGAEGDGHI